jgi:ABC-type Fe3+-hydroxamate transport system substrate-binding protein
MTDSAADSGAGSLVVTDGGGREISLPGVPERVVCLYNSCYGMMATVGVKPIAQSVNPEMLTDPIYFDGTGSDIYTLRYEGDLVDAEDVASVEPDLIIAFSEEEAAALGGIAPVYLEGDVHDLDSLYAEVRRYGTLLNRTEEAEVQIARFSQRLAAYAELAPKDISVLKVGLMDDQVFSIGTVRDPICQLLNLVARCEWTDPRGESEFWSYEASIEGLLALDPDVIILNNWTNRSDDELRAELATNPLWNELAAVKSGRVLSTPGYTNPIASSIPAATKFLDTYLPLLYSETFPTALSEEQVLEVTGQE